MTELDQPRTVDGQYAEKAHSRPQIGLEKSVDVSADEWNADGSLRYPPQYRDPDQAIAFWESVELDDEFLADLRMAYVVDSTPEIDQRMSAWKAAWLVEYEKSNPRPRKLIGSEKAKDAWERNAEIAMQPDYQAALGQVDSQVPLTIKPTDVRTVARVLGLRYFSADNATAADMARIDNSPVTMTDGPSTVGDVYDMYGLNNLAHVFDERISTDDRLAQLVDTINFQTSSMADIQIEGLEAIRFQVEELRKDGWQMADPGLKRQ